jgi:hypothetical protein
MNQTKVKQLTTPDRVLEGVRMFNPSKPHGTVYADGFFEAKYVQEFEGREVYYRGDGTPIGENPGKVIPAVDLARENADLKRQLEELRSKSAQSPGAAGAGRTGK